MKTAIKRKKDEFLVITLKHLNRPQTPKPWAITHENDHKTQKRLAFAHTSQTCKSIGKPQNYGQTFMKMAIKHKKDEFLVITLKHVNCLGTPEPWAITHENGHKTQKRIAFAHTSQTCKSIGKPQNCGQTFMKMAIKHKKDEFLVITLKRVNHPGTPKLWAMAHENGHT